MLLTGIFCIPYASPFSLNDDLGGSCVKTKRVRPIDGTNAESVVPPNSSWLLNEKFPGDAIGESASSLFSDTLKLY